MLEFKLQLAGPGTLKREFQLAESEFGAPIKGAAPASCAARDFLRMGLQNHLPAARRAGSDILVPVVKIENFTAAAAIRVDAVKTDAQW